MTHRTAQLVSDFYCYAIHNLFLICHKVCGRFLGQMFRTQNQISLQITLYVVVGSLGQFTMCLSDLYHSTKYQRKKKNLNFIYHISLRTMNSSFDLVLQKYIWLLKQGPRWFLCSTFQFKTREWDHKVAGDALEGNRWDGIIEGMKWKERNMFGRSQII